MNGGEKEMYKISEQVFAYLLNSSKDMKMPGLVNDQIKPFVAQNDDAIGNITPYLVIGSNCKFLIEFDASQFDKDSDIELKPKSKGYYLYRQEELNMPDDEVLIERKMVDSYSQSEEKVDLTDCSIELPSELDKTHAMSILTIEELFELLPDIKECLDPEREKLFKMQEKIE